MKNPLIWFQNQFSSKKIMWGFILVVMVASVLRLAFLSQGALLGDEPMYSVRSIGWVDTLGSGSQTTPWDWFKPLPWWVKLSFHDHPPLTFAINHIFLNFFGDSVFMARFPSALLGIFLVILAYFFTKKLFKNESLALLSTALVAVNNFVVFYARTSMMEAITLFFIFLALYLLLLALAEPKYLIWFGLATGLALLCKYVAFVIFPIALLLFLFYRRDYFKNYRLYLAILLTILVFSPVLIYNYEMYQATGHFDLQFSYLLNQEPAQWQELPGKIEIGDFRNRVAGLFDIFYYISPVLSFIFVFGLFFSLIGFLKKRKFSEGIVFLVVVLLCEMAMFMVIGTADRFLYYSLPWFCVLVAYLFYNLVGNFRKLAMVSFTIVILFEFFYSFNTNIISQVWSAPLGFKNFNYSPAFIVKDFGILRLDNYLQSELANKKSVLVGSSTNININSFVKNISAADSTDNAYAAMIIYDNRSEINTLLWVYYRRLLYEAWPFFELNGFFGLATQEIPDFLSNENTNFYYISATENTRLNDKAFFLGGLSNKLIGVLNENGVVPVEIYNDEGAVAFYVYKFNGSFLEKIFDKKST